MSYVVENAFVRQGGGYGQYIEMDVSGSVLADLFQEYSEIYLILSHQALPEPETLVLTDIRDTISNQYQTVDQWLDANGNVSLPTVSEMPTIVSGEAVYSDAEQAGYRISMVHPTAHHEAFYPRDDMTDLLLEKEEIDYMDMADKVMVSVNGFYHFIEGAVYGLRVHNGGANVMRSNKNQVSILSFADIGDVVYENIDASMIDKVDDGVGLDTRALIRTNYYNINTSGRIPILVIGGYIHILDGSYYATGDNLLLVETNQLDIYKRYLEAREYVDIDLPSLLETGYEHTTHTASFYSDDVMREYLSQEQSFIVWLSADVLIKETTHLQSANLPGTYYSPITPGHLGLFDSGRDMGYWRRDDDGVWVLITDNALRPNYRYETTQNDTIPVLDEQRDVHEPFTYRDGRLVRIESQTFRLE